MKLIKKKMNNSLIPKEFKEKYVFEEHLLNDKNNYIPKKGEKIFDNEEQFLIIYRNLENKNLMLLRQNNDIKNTTANIKREHEGIFIEKEDDKQSQIYWDILEKEEKLEKVKEKNKYLEERYKSITSVEFNDNNNYTKKLVQQQQNSSFVDLNFFKMLNYLKLLNHYKYHGFLLLEKLITIIKTFISCKYGNYNIERCYHMVGMVDLENILKTNKKTFNEKNKFMIYDYTLKLLTIYEDICIHIKNKEMLYESEIKNKIFIQKKREEVQSMRKISNAREMRELLEEKRLKGIKKLLDKWSLPVKNSHKKVAEKYNFKFNKIKKSKSTSDIEK
jgi:hypothetical protein